MICLVACFSIFFFFSSSRTGYLDRAAVEYSLLLNGRIKLSLPSTRFWHVLLERRSFGVFQSGHFSWSSAGRAKGFLLQYSLWKPHKTAVIKHSRMGRLPELDPSGFTPWKLQQFLSYNFFVLVLKYLSEVSALLRQYCIFWSASSTLGKDVYIVTLLLQQI